MRPVRVALAVGILLAGLLAVGPVSPAAASLTSSGYSFLYRSGGQPVKYAVCTLTWRVNWGALKGRPARKQELATLKVAFARAAKPLGVRMVFRGTTTQRWRSKGASATPSQTITVTFNSAKRGVWYDPALRGSTTATGGSAASSGGPTNKPMSYDYGGVSVDTADVLAARRRGNDGMVAAVYLHELGHVVGLDHVTSPGQLMYPVLSPATPPVWGRGDLAGLRRLRPACAG